MMICPNCGLNQRKSDECVKCGVLIAKFNKNIPLNEGGTDSSHNIGIIKKKSVVKSRKLVGVLLLAGILIFALSYIKKK